MNQIASLIVGALAGIVLAVLVMLLRQPFRDRMVRRDALLRSRAVIAGKVVEQLTPYLPDFPFNPKDARFLGSPVDLVVFDGLDEGAVRRVVFVEVKTNGGTLSERERDLRDAVRARRVEWLEWRTTL
jgi:predicted Holliday junction resolvase-like endonuclease